MENEFEKSLSQFRYYKAKRCLENRYVCDYEIGKGAYGYVLCGFRRSDHCSVAIKVIPNTMVVDWYFSEVLQRKIPLEILLLAHTSQVYGVVKMIEYCEDENLREWYIVMERFSKTIDLFEFICSQGYLDEEVACHLFRQLVTIVIGCHLLGVLHRDIKEENILVDISNNNQLRLIDFGSGTIMRSGYLDQYNGTTAYCPPEWITNKQYIGCQLECWSIGVVLYSMVCGCVPFEDEEQIIAITKQKKERRGSLVNGVHFPRRDLSMDCQDLIKRCLDPDPVNRISPVEMLSHKWMRNYETECDSGRCSFDEAFERVDTNSSSLSEGIFSSSGSSRRHSTFVGAGLCPCSLLSNKSSPVTLTSNVSISEIMDASKKLSNSSTLSFSKPIAAIEALSYNEECFNSFDRDQGFRYISRSLSSDANLENSFMKFNDQDNIQRSLTSLNNLLSLKPPKFALEFEDDNKDELDSDFQFDIQVI